jgi:hypothetical protein
MLTVKPFELLVAMSILAVPVEIASRGGQGDKASADCGEKYSSLVFLPHI